MTKNYELTGYTQSRRVMRFDEITHIDVRLTDQIEDFPREKYEVNFNLIGNFTYQYNPETKKFYIDTLDHDALDKQSKEHEELIEGKSKEEQAELLKGKYVEYLKRQEFVILCGNKQKNVTMIIDDLIKSVGI